MSKMSDPESQNTRARVGLAGMQNRKFLHPGHLFSHEVDNSKEGASIRGASENVVKSWVSPECS